MKYVNMFTVGGAVFALLAAAAVVSVLLPGTGVPAQQVVVLPAANVSTASESDVEVEAVEGTLSDFWGEVTQYADHLWFMKNADGRAVVEASGNILTIYFEDERPDTVAEVVQGTPADFMEILSANQTCGGCTNQTCCDTVCGEIGGCQWMLCSARVTCGDAGVKRFSCNEFECYEPVEEPD